MSRNSLHDVVEGQIFVRQLTLRSRDQGAIVYDRFSRDGPYLWSQVILATDYLLGEEPVTGSVVLWTEPGHVPVSPGPVEMIVRPAGFTRELDRFGVEIVEGGTAEFYYNSETPGGRAGMFEIVADIPYAANMPGRYFRR